MDGLEPAQLVHPCGAQAGLRVHRHLGDEHRHGHGAGVPAARREPAEMRLGSGFVGEVEGLRVIFARKVEHFLARDLVTAEAPLRANLYVIQIEHGISFG